MQFKASVPKTVPVSVPRLTASSTQAASFPPPTPNGAPTTFGNALKLNGTETDTQSIDSTVLSVNQKGGANDNSPPNQPVPETTVTAVDGQVLTNQTTVSSAPSTLGLFQNMSTVTKRQDSGYEEVFTGSVSGPDGSIEGIAYLTYTVDIDGCLSFCDSVDQCGS